MVTSQGREEIKDAPFVSLFINNLPALVKELTYLKPRMRISVSTDILVLGFYGYIGYIGDISVDIFT